MSFKVSVSEMVFRDLSDSFTELIKETNSPLELRRSFGRFLTLSQQLTETMRKEYKSSTGEDWAASKFANWNNVTDLFKKLRRSDYHEFPVLINVRENQYYLAEVLEDEMGNEYNGYIIATVTWGIGDPFSEEIPSSMKLIGYDENMVQVEDLEPEKVEYEFILNPRTEEIKKAIELAGSDDIIVLSRECFCILKEYYEFYKISLNEHETRKKVLQNYEHE